MQEGINLGNADVAKVVENATCAMDKFILEIFAGIKGGPQLTDYSYFQKVYERINTKLQEGDERFSRQYFYNRGLVWPGDDLYLRYGARTIRYHWRIRELFVLDILLKLARVYHDDKFDLYLPLACKTGELMHKLSWYVYVRGANENDWLAPANVFERAVAQGGFANFEKTMEEMICGLMRGVLSLSCARVACVTGMHTKKSGEYAVFAPTAGLDVAEGVDLIVVEKQGYRNLLKRSSASQEVDTYEIGTRPWINALSKAGKDTDLSEIVHFIQVKTGWVGDRSNHGNRIKPLSAKAQSSFAINLAENTVKQKQLVKIRGKMQKLFSNAGAYLVSVNPHEYKLFLPFD